MDPYVLKYLIVVVIVFRYCSCSRYIVAEAPIEGGWGPSPPRPQDFQNNVNFIGFITCIDSIFNIDS